MKKMYASLSESREVAKNSNAQSCTGVEYFSYRTAIRVDLYIYIPT
jgi:hypothetical protein